MTVNSLVEKALEKAFEAAKSFRPPFNLQVYIIARKFKVYVNFFNYFFAQISNFLETSKVENVTNVTFVNSSESK